MKANRIRTSTAAKIIGVDHSFLIEKMRLGEYPIGSYEKNGKKAHVIILAGLLAKFLGRSIEEIDDAVKEIEEGGAGQCISTPSQT